MWLGEHGSLIRALGEIPVRKIIRRETRQEKSSAMQAKRRQDGVVDVHVVRVGGHLFDDRGQQAEPGVGVALARARGEEQWSGHRTLDERLPAQRLEVATNAEGETGADRKSVV